jgi:hypothetical protein
LANVTRFFCGCFSKGELLDLAERVKDLIADTTLGEIRHPALLAAMLLSDWVFAQTPKALNEVATSLAQPSVLRKLLTVPNLYEPPGEEVQVPAICGGSKLVASAFAMAKVSIRRHDLCDALADFIRVNESPDEIDRCWLSMISEISMLEIRNWCAFGLALGTIQRLSPAQLDQALGPPPYRMEIASRLAEGGQFQRLLGLDEDVNVLEHILFDRPFHLRQRRSDGGLFLLPYLIDHHRIWTMDGGRHLQRLFGDRFQDFDEKMGLYDKASQASMIPLVSSAYGTSRGISAIYKAEREGAGRPRAIEMLEDIVQGLLDQWGARPGILAMANSICHLPRGLKGRTKASELFLAEARICDRIRWAKGRNKKTEWWLAQLNVARSKTDQFLFHLVFWTWGDVAVALERADGIASSLDGLDYGEWCCLLEFLRPMMQRFPQDTSEVEISRNIMAGISSSRLALLVGIKDTKVLGREAFLEHLLAHGDGSRGMAEFRQFQAFKAAVGGVIDWNTAMGIIKDTYSEGAAGPLSRFLWAVTNRLKVPESIINEVITNSHLFPLALSRMAENAVSEAMRKRVRPVIRVAQSEGWEGVDPIRVTTLAKPRRATRSNMGL